MGKIPPHRTPKNRPPADEISSGRVIGIVGDVGPAPSLRELSSKCETEGVSFGGCFGPTVYSQSHKKALKLLPFTYTEVHSLSHALAGVPAPSGREPGTVGLYHSTHRPETGRLRATFIAPTKTQKPFPFTTHRGTLPQSRPLGVPAPSGREPGWGYTIHRGTR